MYINEEVMEELERRTGYDRELLDKVIGRFWYGVRRVMQRPDIFPKGLSISWFKVKINYLWATHHLHRMLKGNVKLNKMALEAYRPSFWLKVLDRYDATTRLTSEKARRTNACRKARWRERERLKMKIDYERATENFDAEVQRRVEEYRKALRTADGNHADGGSGVENI